LGPNPLQRKLLQNVLTPKGGNRYYLKFSNEGVGANDIEGGNTENSVGIVDSGLHENFTGNGDGAVDLFLNQTNNDNCCTKTKYLNTYGVSDDSNQSFGANFSTSNGQVTNDRSIDVEKIVTGHAGLARNTSGNDDYFTTF
jgi:hypothetical protein